jgi:hypothetical protein
MDNNFLEMFEIVESGDIYDEIMLASNISTMIARLERSQEACLCEQKIAADEALRCAFLKRVEELYQQPCAEIGYQSEIDLPLCGYLYLLKNHWSYELITFIAQIEKEQRCDLPNARTYVKYLFETPQNNQVLAVARSITPPIASATS